MASRTTVIRQRFKALIESGEVVLCALCNEPIPRKSKKTNKGSVSVDHIIRKRDGGKDTIDNLRPTHSKCNQLRN